MSSCVPHRDGCVVDTAHLAAVLTDWKTAWASEKSKNAGCYSGAGERVAVPSLGPVQWLAMESERIAEQFGQPTLRVPAKSIERIVSARSRTTELRVADTLLTIIGRSDVLTNGTLAVLPNPRARRADQEACAVTNAAIEEARSFVRCCGGSLSGVGASF